MMNFKTLHQLGFKSQTLQNLPSKTIVSWVKIDNTDFISIRKHFLWKGDLPDTSVKALRTTKNYTYAYEAMAFRLESYIQIVNAVLLMDGLVNNRPIDVINTSQTEAVETIYESIQDMDIDQFKDAIRSLSMTQPIDFQDDIRRAYFKGRVDQLELFGVGGIDPEVVGAIDQESAEYSNKWIKDKLDLQ